jgi:hypothetical protein
MPGNDGRTLILVPDAAEPLRTPRKRPFERALRPTVGGGHLGARLCRTYVLGCPSRPCARATPASRTAHREAARAGGGIDAVMMASDGLREQPIVVETTEAEQAG